ncbi:glycosyltransferase [Salegentibacter sp. F14]
MDEVKEIYVSVFVLTYNQEEFIGQTIESILDQETNFKIQLVIGEDCSTDDTRRICEKYEIDYPELIKLLPSKKNHGLIKNFIRTYKECEGKYVAICDGDDYWTDPLKLQKQVDFLESNSDYSIIFTSFKFLFPDGRMVEKNYSNQSTNTNFEDLIFGNYISSVTAVFRNKKTIADFPDWLGTCPYGDWPLYLWTARNGSKIKFLKDVTAVYRREIGVSEKMKLVPSKIALENLKIVKNVGNDSHFPKFQREIKESLLKHQKELLVCHIREHQYFNALQMSFKMFLRTPLKMLHLYAYLIKRKCIPLK